jgi:hypothetical protein
MVAGKHWIAKAWGMVASISRMRLDLRCPGACLVCQMPSGAAFEAAHGDAASWRLDWTALRSKGREPGLVYFRNGDAAGAAEAQARIAAG